MNAPACCNQDAAVTNTSKLVLLVLYYCTYVGTPHITVPTQAIILCRSLLGRLHNRSTADQFLAIHDAIRGAVGAALREFASLHDIHSLHADRSASGQ